MTETKFLISYPEVRIVDASAGSGKTYALAHRYVQLLFQKDSRPEVIKTILAITFTNMATREMKERILEFLKKIALDSFPNENEREQLLSKIEMDRTSARRFALQIVNYIIHNYNFFQIQTIDSFIYLLLSGCAFRLGLPANFKLQESFRRLLIYSLDECIDRASKDKKIRDIFYDFLQQYVFIENKENWFPKRDILSLLNSLLYQMNIYGREFRKFEYDAQYVLKGKREIKKLVTQFYNKYASVLNGTFTNSLANFCEQEEEIFDFATMAGKNSRKKTFIYEYPPVKRAVVVPPQLEKDWQELRNKIGKMAAAEAQAVFNCYIDIFRLVYQIFEARAQKEELMFLQELNRKANTLFGEEFSVPEIYYRLATRFQHFLIDEFQDTSGLQWKNLFLMIEEALSSGGTLFYVGDKKQAIYRWRGGEVKLFDHLKEILKDFNVKEERLTVNYRSQREIVEFNNTVFSRENLKRFLVQKFKDNNLSDNFSYNDCQEILDVFSTVCQEYKPENKYGYVKITKIEGEDKEEREQKIRSHLIEIISDITTREFTLSDIAILCRSNDEVENVSNWLLEDGFSVQSEKTLNIKNNPVIKELISFLKFLKSPIDNLSFVTFITGRIFLEATGMDRKQLEKFLLEFNSGSEEKSSEYVYRAFRNKYPEVWNKYLEEFFKSVGFLGTYELVLSIIDKFRILQNFPYYQGFVMHLLELLKEKEEEYSNLEEFLEYYETTEEEVFYLKFSESDAIRVTTIHKAKGLEFPVVIIPFLDLDVKPGRSNDIRSFSYVVSPYEDKLRLLRLDKKYVILSLEIREIYKEEYKHSIIDELNIIYVAFTRAQYELYAFLPCGKRKKNIAADLIPPECWERGEKRIYSREKKKTDEFIFISPCGYKNWFEFLKDESVPRDLLESRQEIERGNILHFILSFISDLSVQDKSQVLEDACAQIKFRYRHVLRLDEYRQLIDRIVDDNAFRKFFYLDGGRVYQEKEIVDSQGLTKRVDRLIIKDNEVWVVEYKTGIPVPEYREQVKGYIDIIRRIYPGYKVRGYILYLDTKIVEEIDG